MDLHPSTSGQLLPGDGGWPTPPGDRIGCLSSDEYWSGRLTQSVGEPDLLLLQWLEQVAPTQVSHLREQMAENPSRITKAYRDLLSGESRGSQAAILKVTEMIESGSYQGIVTANSVDYMSFCSHHFLPFHGQVDVIYQPGDRILGIGKLSRLVDFRTRCFTIQETIAQTLVDDLMTYGSALGAMARVSARHSCLCYRGPTKYGSSNVSVFSAGSCRDGGFATEIAAALG